MLRLLGIVLGSLLSIGVFVTAVGIPTLQLGDSTAPATVSNDIAVTLADPIAPDVAEAEPDALPKDESPDAIPPIVIDPRDDENVSPPAAPLSATPESATESTTVRWYAFWSPFRSRVAANGFVAQLQRVTSLDYRVVNVKPGVYEVAFAYADDADIEASLTEISTATGLSVPEA